MHIRVLLSRYRSYDECPDCAGARLKPDALLWRLGSRENADAVLSPEARFRPVDLALAARAWQAPGSATAGSRSGTGNR